jgi:hypothetical protein
MGSENHTAFFSYSREDGAFAKKLASDLKASGAQIWMDQLDIEPGTHWDDAVSHALENSLRVLVILSPASATSENVSDEVGFALSKQKHIIPVLYRDCDVPFRLARLQYIDFRTDYAGGVQELTRLLALQPPALVAVAPEPPRPAAEVAPSAQHPPAPVSSLASAGSGAKKAVLMGILVLLAAAIIAYFAFRPSGLDVAILVPSGFSAPRFTIDGKNYPIEGQTIHVKLARGDHQFQFPKTGCGGTFNVAPGKTTFVPTARGPNDCSLQPTATE